MIRDVWNIRKRNLAQAIEALKKRVDPDAWKAIDGVRTVGNIGAHMEKDVNLIVAVDPKEAEILLRLLEALVDDWYVKPRDRQALYAKVTSVAQQKALARKPGAALAPSSPMRALPAANSTQSTTETTTPDDGEGS
jgi:DNA-binding response OmpR family regulator